MRPRQLLFAFILMTAVLATVSAAGVDITVIPKDNVIAWDETATYTIKITNTLGAADSFRLRPSDFYWGTLTFSEPVVYVLPGSTVNVEASFIPPRNILVGSYAVEMLAVSNTDSDIRARCGEED